MSDFWAFLIYIVLSAINIFMLALCIEDAVKYFKSGKYFRFGVEVALSIMFILSMINQSYN